MAGKPAPICSITENLYLSKNAYCLFQRVVGVIVLCGYINSKAAGFPLTPHSSLLTPNSPTSSLFHKNQCVESLNLYVSVQSVSLWFY